MDGALLTCKNVMVEYDMELFTTPSLTRNETTRGVSETRNAELKYVTVASVATKEAVVAPPERYKVLRGTSYVTDIP